MLFLHLVLTRVIYQKAFPPPLLSKDWRQGEEFSLERGFWPNTVVGYCPTKSRRTSLSLSFCLGLIIVSDSERCCGWHTCHLWGGSILGQNMRCSSPSKTLQCFSPPPRLPLLSCTVIGLIKGRNKNLLHLGQYLKQTLFSGTAVMSTCCCIFWYFI